LAAVIWYENALPCVPFAVVALVMTGAGTATGTVGRIGVMPPGAPPLVVPSDPEQVAAVVGVPKSKLVVPCSDRTTGNPVATQLAIMVRVSVARAVPWLVVAESATPKVPGAMGVPEIKPVAVFTFRSAGKPVAP
jgi:hypothetical protein